jgi:hypothetical protein
MVPGCRAFAAQVRPMKVLDRFLWNIATLVRLSGARAQRGLKRTGACHERFGTEDRDFGRQRTGAVVAVSRHSNFSRPSAHPRSM